MKSKNITRIAMWSGPRNISTAMMRSFENREDTIVIDEPFYAYYLKKSGICLLYTSPSPRDGLLSRMPSSA